MSTPLKQMPERPHVKPKAPDVRRHEGQPTRSSSVRVKDKRALARVLDETKGDKAR